MNTTHRHVLAIVTMLSVAGVAPAAVAAEGDDWQWIIAPYGWAASISTDLDTGVPLAGGTEVDTDFDDIVDKLDGAFQMHVEGQGEHYGVLADLTYVGLADGRDRPRFRTESDLDTRLFELAGVWSPGAGHYQGLELFGGLRYIDVDLTVRFDPTDPLSGNSTFDGSKSFSDFMLGARYSWALSDRWSLTLRGDGSFGDTEGSWNASAVMSYRTKHGAWLFGYRHLMVEFETGASTTELTLSGPQVGYGFFF